MTFKVDWWWPLQEEINAQFGFSKVREKVASKIVSRLGNFSKSLDLSFRNRNFVLVGAGLSDFPEISQENLIVADGALRPILQRGLVPEWIVSDLDGYIPDIIWARENGSNLIVHAHGDNISRVFQYCESVNPTCITTTYPSSNTPSWGGFTDGDRSVMMCLSLGSKSIKLMGFDFEKVGLFSGDYSPRKKEKLVWAKRIIDECQKRTSSISYY